MKINFKRMKKIVIFSAILFSIISCESIDEVHEKWIEDGEIVYSVKPDNVKVISGYNRCAVQAMFINTPNLEKCIIEWNDQKIETDISATSDTIFFEKLINDIEEGANVFDVYSMDNKGNKSIKVLGFGSVYGDDYRSKIFARNILKTSWEESGALIDFNVNPEKSVGVSILYMDMDDKDQTVLVPSTDNQVLLLNAKPGSTISYYTLYLPEENCLDTIATLNPVTLELTTP